LHPARPVGAARSPIDSAPKTSRRRRTPLDLGVQGQLRDRIVRFLEEECLDPDEWARRLQSLEGEGGPLVYSILLFVLARLDLPPARARNCWEHVLGEWRTINLRLGEAVDLRLAVLQYFLRRERKLENPAIVELRVLHRTEDSAIVDELTRLYNFRYFQERLREEVRRADRYQRPLALLMLDADDFKAFNDTYGHLAGNAALRRLGQVLKRSVREVDFVARYGGEEFAVIVPDTPKKGALRLAEKVRAAVERARIGGGLRRRTLTVSVGLACFPGDATDDTRLVERTDRGLYMAKGLGKNRVKAFSDERREHPRVDTLVHGRFSRLAEDSRPLATCNISEGGLLFTNREPLPVASLVHVRLQLPRPHEPVEGILRVARVVPGTNGHDVRTVFVHIARADRRRLRAYLAAVQGNGETGGTAILSNPPSAVGE
jgi:diguanylate cyclase (GGDEF)-like protein